MNKLDLIWALENHNNSLEKLRNKKGSLAHKLGIAGIENIVEALEREVVLLKEKMALNKRQIRDNERLLKEHSFKIEEIEEDLYNGEIQDIKQLEYLSKEKEKSTNIIDNMEIEIITLMEEDEEDNKTYEAVKSRLVKSQRDLFEKEKEYNETKSKIGEEMDSIRVKIHETEKKIDKDSLERYYKIKNEKNKGIVAVEDYICSGCNMRIPTYLGKELKNREKVIYCEYCGRIYIMQGISGFIVIS